MKSNPKIVEVRYGDATTQVETDDCFGDKAIVRILRGDGWTWLDMPARLALAQAIAGDGYVMVPKEPDAELIARLAGIVGEYRITRHSNREIVAAILAALASLTGTAADEEGA